MKFTVFLIDRILDKLDCKLQIMATMAKNKEIKIHDKWLINLWGRKGIAEAKNCAHQ